MTNDVKLRSLEKAESEFLSWVGTLGYDGKTYAWVRNTLTSWKKLVYRKNDETVYSHVLLAMTGLKKYFSSLKNLNAYDPIASMYFVSIQLGAKIDKSILKTSLMLIYMPKEEWDGMDLTEINKSDACVAGDLLNSYYQSEEFYSIAFGLFGAMVVSRMVE